MQTNQSQRKEQDGVHKWLVFFSAYVTVALNVGFCFTFGALFLAIMEEFDITRAQAAAMQSTWYAVFLGSGIVAGPLIRKYGTRKAGFLGSVGSSLGIMTSYFASSITFLVVSLSIITGVGLSMMYISASVATEKQFEGKRKLVLLSLMVSGTAVGAMFFPYFLVYLNDVYGVQGTLLIVGIICGHSIPSSLLWTSDTAAETTGEDNAADDVDDNPTNVQVSSHGEVNVGYEIENGNSCDGAVELGCGSVNSSVDDFDKFGRTVRISEHRLRRSDTQESKNTENKPEPLTTCGSVIHLMKDKTFMLFLIALAISFPMYTIPLIFIVEIFVDKGYAESDASLALLVIGLTGIFGRICPGFLIQIPKFPTIGVPVIASLVGAMSMLGITALPNVGASIASCAVLGLCHGIFVSMLTVVPARLIERENLPTAMGLLFTGAGIGSTAIGPVIGLIRDRTNSYNLSLYSAVGCLVLAAGIFTLAHITRRQTKMEKKKENSTPVFHVTCSKDS